jgi:hypothetical protein
MTSVASRFGEVFPHPVSARRAPVRFGALLRRAHQLYWEHFGTFAGLMFLPIIFSTLLASAGAAAPRAFEFWFVVVAGIALLVMSAVAWAALIWAVAEADSGRPVAIRNALKHARALAWGRIVLTVLLVWALFMAFVVVGGTALALTIEGFGELLAGLPVAVKVLIGLLLVALLGGPLLRWVVRLLFLPQVMVLEHRWGMAAIRRTGDLMRGNWWRALVCWLGFAAIEALISTLLFRWTLAHALAQFVVAPLGGIWVTLFYRVTSAVTEQS